MCDSMAICLSDVLNDSCFPRTLGSETEPPSSTYLPEITAVGVIKFTGMFIGTLFAIFLIYYGLSVWFMKYKLKYFLRMNICLWVAVSILDKLFGNDTFIHKEYHPYLVALWNYSVIASLVMLFVRYNWNIELSIVKKFHEVDFQETKMKNSLIREKFTRLYKTMDLEAYPPCFPNGWIPLIEMRDLLDDRPVGVDALGHRFAIYKGEDSGKVMITDAFCPHLGADLTVGGRVRGDCIECAFHGWLVDGNDGSCKRGPSRDPKKEKPQVPDSTRTRTWHARDVNGFVYVWYHAEPDQQEPTWEMPRVDPICNGRWLYRGRTEHFVRSHIQEIPENGADINHLEQLHSVSVFLGINWMNSKSWLNVVTHHWQPEWKRDEENPHIARISLKQKTTFLGITIPFSSLDISIQQIGPATVYLHINSYFGRGILTQHIIPEGPLFMRVVHQLYTEEAVKPFWAELLIKAEATMFEGNISLLHRKENIRAPPPENSRTRAYHRWYHSTFYSTYSPTLQSLQDRTLLF